MVTTVSHRSLALDSAVSFPNDMDPSCMIMHVPSQRYLDTPEELALIGTVTEISQADDVLQLGELNTKFVNGVAYPNSNTIAEHNNSYSSIAH